MPDETRDRPEEIDFGPGALDHRISLEARTAWEARRNG